MNIFTNYTPLFTTQPKTFLVAFVLFFTFNSVFSQVTIWEEHFNTYLNGTGVDNTGDIGDYPTNVSKWTLNVTNANLTSANNYFKTTDSFGSNVMTARDLDGFPNSGLGEAIWLSESIDISNYINVELGANFRESGDMEVDDFYRIEYSLDGGAWTTFTNNGYNNDDYSGASWVFAQQTGLLGATVQIRITVSCDREAEYQNFDTIKVKGDYNLIDWCNFQSPATGTIMLGTPVYNVYTRVHEAGVTNQVAESTDIETWIGVSVIDATTLADFETSDWTWIPATFNSGFDTASPNDEYQANIAPTIITTGTHYIVSRYSYLGNPYQYGGYNSNNGSGGSGGFWGETTNGMEHVEGEVNVKTISIIGDAAGGWLNGNDIDMTSVDGITYTLTQALALGDLKFRDQHDWGGTDWGDNGDGFPAGIATSPGVDLAVTPAATYYITFNVNTLAYTFTSSDCEGGTTTWNAGWSAGPPDNTKKAIIAGNYDMTTQPSFTSCGCQINVGITLTVEAGKYLEVVHDIENNGTIVVEHEGSLVQPSNASTLSGVGGSYEIYKQTTPYTEYDYTYWSSPVVNETIGNAFNMNTTVNSVANSDGDAFSPPYYILTLNTANFLDGDNDSFDDNGDDWNTSVTGIMTPGIGYAAMGAGSDFPFNTTFATGLVQSLFFQDQFVNNGEITVPVFLDGGADGFDNQNLIGNPYPSAIDLELFKNDADNTELTGTFYIWSHDSVIGSGGNAGPEAYNFSNLDYATFNANVGIGAAANNTAGTSTGAIPSKYLASCQGFIADVGSAGDIKFKNTMRVTGSNDNFFNPNTIEKDIIWLKFTNETGLYRQTAIAFVPEASDLYDSYDSKRMESGTITDFYSLPIDNNQILAIQGLGAFNDSKTVELGMEITETNIYEIAIDKLEGIFNTNQAIYIEDTYTNAYHNLKTGAYTFGSNIGNAINDRFVLHFVTSSLEVSEDILLAGAVVYPNPSNAIFNIGIQSEKAISIAVYDLTGKILVSKANTLSRTIDLSGYSQGFYFAKISQNGQSIVKKLILK